jgi:predicted AAA+ superfamily ATPase
MTASSARKLKRVAVDLLAGRAAVRTLHPFMAAELGSDFDLESALRIGLVPLVVGADEPEDALHAYFALYLREEVQQEGIVRNSGAFLRFLEAISFSHASVLNVANVARECAVERKTAAGYVEILEDLLLASRLEVFSRRAKRALVAHPKFYFFDAGVFRAARPSGPLDRATEIEGAALEGLVFQHLRAWNAYRGERNSLHYWRTRSGVEVDFVAYGPDGLWAIEVKNSRLVHPTDLRSLSAFGEEHPRARRICLHRGRERAVVDGILCLPCTEFLVGLHPSRSALVEHDWE